ncbi:hypothetical protein JX265_004640 [Neoarthrinium moseri]|uniref:Sialidase n=1 Tax=Neoarthrinium moseri TaxID=1658444 RepID=A0A9Q0AN85_9PEZI|nr:hypothetical protein JX265_004640 [Neoarthrinium moseri]
MASLAADMSFFTYPSCEPATPPSFTFDPSFLEIPYHPGHARTTSYGSICSTIESSPADSVSTRVTTPSRSPPPIRQHGPLLLPKIRSQDQEIKSSPPKRLKTLPAPVAKRSRQGTYRPSHTRSFTNPETLNQFASSYFTQAEDQSQLSQSLMCSPVIFPQDQSQSRRASTVSLDGTTLEKYGFPTYRQMPSYVPAVTQPQVESYMYAQYTPRAPSPLSIASTPEPIASTTLMNYLTTANPAPSLVRTISFPLRDPNTKHFWWDVRQIRPWTAFTSSTILSLPDASGLLNCPVPAPLLPQPATSARHPETEAALHNIYASYYVPKLNSALAVSSQRPLQLSVPSKPTNPNDHIFTANVAGDSASAAAIFGGKPTARVVGLVKSFDRFNTGMRVEGNIKRVEYLRGLAHLHHVMREHGCRYGFILTEIELVVVRNGAEGTPHFGYLEVASVQLAATGEGAEDDEEQQLTACLALWGLCTMASDEAAPGHCHWKSEIGAPAEGTRRKALGRDDWMPQPQLAEKREAKRTRGWVFPEDPVGRKELGKRGVRYGGC